MIYPNLISIVTLF